MLGTEKIDVLKRVNFNVHENSFNIVFGPSGSGKSTLLNILTGLQKPTEGKVTFDDIDVYGLAPDELAHFRANRIGIVYQQNYWVNSLPVIENVALPLYFMGQSRPVAAQQAMRALESVGMGGYAKKMPTLLSGGEQQRIAVARAIVSNPECIIADEPTGSLDSTNGDMIMNLLRSFQTDLNRTIILVTHNMEYLPLADYLLHIQDGITQSMESGDIIDTTNELLNDLKQRIDTLGKAKRDAKAA